MLSMSVFFLIIIIIFDEGVFHLQLYFSPGTSQNNAHKVNCT